MVKDAETHESEDKLRKEAIEARNQLDSLVFQMEKMLNENRDKIDAAARADVERGIEGAKKILEEKKDAGKDAEPFKTAFNQLQQASYKMAEQMYKTAAPSGGDGGGGGAPGGGAPGAEQTTQEQKDVIDAEFEEQPKQ